MQFQRHLQPILRTQSGHGQSLISAVHANSGVEYVDIRSLRCADVRSNCLVPALYVWPTEDLVRLLQMLHNIMSDSSNINQVLCLLTGVDKNVDISNNCCDKNVSLLAKYGAILNLIICHKFQTFNSRMNFVGNFIFFPTVKE